MNSGQPSIEPSSNRRAVTKDLGRPILVVEDDPDLRESMTLLLLEEGYAVDSVCNGQEALAYLRNRPPPVLILLDLMMPIMSGGQFREAQLQNPNWAGIPVLVLSAKEEGWQRDDVSNAQAYLRKPMDVDRLLKLVERYLP